MTNRQSFDNGKKWMDSINESYGNNKECCIILIGNKSDLIEGNNKNLREIEEQEAKDKCNEYNMFFGGEISIKTIDYNELKELFNVYVKKIYEKVGDKYFEQQPIKKLESYRRHEHRMRKSCC